MKTLRTAAAAAFTLGALAAAPTMAQAAPVKACSSLSVVVNGQQLVPAELQAVCLPPQ